MTTSVTVIDRVFDYLTAHLGDAYAWGGAGPATFDCSGLVMEAYAYAGITVPRITQEQIAFGVGVPLNIGAWYHGDVLFPVTNPPYGHVQIFDAIIDGVPWIIEAPHRGGVVQRVPEWALEAGGSGIAAVRRYVTPSQPHVPPAPTPPAWPGRYLQLTAPHMAGADVTEWQTELVLRKYHLGTSGPDQNGVDGDFGPMTDTATRAFQTAAGLAVDGDVGRLTWTAAFG